MPPIKDQNIISSNINTHTNTITGSAEREVWLDRPEHHSVIATKVWKASKVILNIFPRYTDYH